MRNSLAAVAILASLTAAATSAHADDQTPPPTAAPAVPAVIPGETPMVAPPIDAPVRDDRAKFSGGRYVVEVLVGVAAGSLAFYAAYSGMCSGNANDDCVGPLLAATAADLAIMPIAQWGVGSAMGGHGSLATTYYGEVVALGAAPAGTTGLAVAGLAMPFITALGYEISSNNWYREHDGHLTVMPVGRAGQTTGAVASVSLQF